jgi:hypothetical protein
LHEQVLLAKEEIWTKIAHYPGFAKDMEKIIISMVEEGICTKDIAGLIRCESQSCINNRFYSKRSGKE